jgi:hypothetical protein
MYRIFLIDADLAQRSVKDITENITEAVARTSLTH